MGEVPQILTNSILRLHHTRQMCAATRVHDAPSPLRLWHLISLDAPTVAVIWTLAFAWTVRVALPLWVPILLALVAWTVYIGDRLLDARSALRTGRHTRLRLRHRFHWRHRRIFLPVAACAACAAAILVFSLMPVASRERNSLLAAAALVYFTRVHSTTHRASGSRAGSPFQSRSHVNAPFPSPLLSKEMLVGLLFTTACVLPALTRANLPPSALWTLILPTVFFALLAWLNCHAIEFWESRSRPRNARGILAPAVTLSLICLVTAITLTRNHPRPAALIAAGALSSFLLAVLHHCRGRLTPLALRSCADLVLLTPLPLLFLAQ
jgi:hypothetical protein